MNFRRILKHLFVPHRFALRPFPPAMLKKIELRDAERLKVEKGSALASKAGSNDVVHISQADQVVTRPMQRRVLCEIIEARVRETYGFVCQRLEHAGFGGPQPAGILLTGGGSLLDGIDDLVSEMTGESKVRVVQPKASGGHSREIGNPSMAAAVGLARYALEGESDDFEPASGQTGWSQAVKTLKSVFGSKA